MGRLHRWEVWEGRATTDRRVHLVRKSEAREYWLTLCYEQAVPPHRNVELGSDWDDCDTCWYEAARRSIDVRPARPHQQDAWSAQHLEPAEPPSGWSKLPDQAEELRQFNRAVVALAARTERPTTGELEALRVRARALGAGVMLFDLAGRRMPDDWYPALLDLEEVARQLQGDPTAAAGLVRVATKAAEDLARQ